MKIATTIGSMPHLSADDALDIIINCTPRLVAWPQLPRRAFSENMTAQYSENFPGLVRDPAGKKLFVSKEKALSGLEQFYEKYLADDIDYFAITPDASAGLHALLARVSQDRAAFPVKCQTAGPVTFAMMLKTDDDRPVFFDENLRDAAVKNVAMKSVWQLKAFGGACRTIFLDEPYLSAYGSAFTALSREDVVETLRTAFEEVRRLAPVALGPAASPAASSSGISIGVHCCGNTDWSLLIDAGADIISFDSYGFSESLTLATDSLKKFIGRGGVLAWGAVPTSADALFSETPASLAKRLADALKTLAAKGLDEKTLLAQMLVTPSCGLGSLDEKTAAKALEYTKILAESAV